MKIRRRGHPIDPQKSPARNSVGMGKRLPTGERMSRYGTALYSHKGDVIISSEAARLHLVKKEEERLAKLEGGKKPEQPVQPAQG